MPDRDIPADLLSLDHHLRAISAVAPNHAHRSRLRNDLLVRHRELRDSLPARRRAATRKLTLLISPIVAVAAALALFFSGFAGSGHQATPSVEAARITAVLARTVPTVTGVQLTYHRQRAGMSEEYRCLPQGGQHLYIRDGRTYIYTHNRWYQLSRLSSAGQCPQSWQLAFASLPARLAAHRFSLLAPRTVRGVSTIGIRYAVVSRSGGRVVVTAWVDRATGLIMRLIRVQIVGGRIVARDIADYRYQRIP